MSAIQQELVIGRIPRETEETCVCGHEGGAGVTKATEEDKVRERCSISPSSQAVQPPTPPPHTRVSLYQSGYIIYKHLIAAIILAADTFFFFFLGSLGNTPPPDLCPFFSCTCHD